MLFFGTKARLRRLIKKLGRLVTREEAKNGWRPEIKQSTKAYFEDLLSRLIFKLPLPSLDIVRSLDRSGVTGGRLLIEIARAVNRLR